MRPDDPRPPDEFPTLDEMASAIVDGEENLPADAEPTLVERVATLRAVREAIGGPVPPPPDAVREAGIAAALKASQTSMCRLPTQPVLRRVMVS